MQQQVAMKDGAAGYAASVTGAAFTDESGRLLRSRSAEDLSQEQLKSTEDDTVLIFIEYVKNKLDKSTHQRPPEVDAELEAETRRRRDSRARERARGSLRRLHSEPNGPKTEEYRRNGECRGDGGVRQVTAPHCEFAASPPRPTALVLDRPPSNRDERRQRASQAAASRSISTNSSGSSSDTATTPSCTLHGPAGLSSSAVTPVTIPDPPLSVGPGGVIPPCEDGDFASSYPPLSSHRMHTVVSSPAITGGSSAAVAGRPASLEYFCTSQQPLTPQMTRAAITRDTSLRRQHYAKLIANKLKIFGDEISSTHEEQLQHEFAQLLNVHVHPQQIIDFYSDQLRHMVLGLSWQNIGKIFHLSYHLIQILSTLLGPSAETTGTQEWAEFSHLWDFTIGSVTRWISTHGGWRAFPADSTSTPTPSPDQPSCPATPSFQRVRSRLLSLSENGEFEFIDEEGYPLSADTISTTSSEIGLCDEREDQLGSSVDLLHDSLEGSTSESSLTSPPYLPATVTPISVPPPCTTPTSTQNHTHSSPKKHSKQKTKSNVMLASSSSAAVYSSSTVAFANGIAQPSPSQVPHKSPAKSHSRTPPKKKSHSVRERSASGAGCMSINEPEMEGQLSRTGSLPAGAMRRRSGSGNQRRTSNTAFNGLVIGVGGAAVAYAAVSALMRR